MSKVINQEDNYSANFGAAFRSSAIFYKPKNIKTTLSFSNYWLFKNNIEVGLVCTIRALDGALVSRKEISFGESNVLNILIDEIDEGAIEIEAFSSKNLRIPYAAIMGIYEDKNSISMVHTYGRNHSLIELEDDKSIVSARESCWTVRSKQNGSRKNIGIFHNGHVELNEQQGVLKLTDISGTDSEYTFTIPCLKPFETHQFDLEHIVPNLYDVLKGDIGWASVHFESKSAFTRLMLIWHDKDLSEFQVTHSNFDYTAHKTNHIDSNKPAYMVLPTVRGKLPEVLIYPKFSPGVYEVIGEFNDQLDNKKQFESGINISPSSNVLEFYRADGNLPARIVTALTGGADDNKHLPFECSLGVVHEKRPPKRFHWLVVSSKYESRVHLTSIPQIYAKKDGPVELVFRMYTSNSLDIIEKQLSYDALEDVPAEIPVEDLFDLSHADDFAYLSVFSHYGGFFVYSSIEKNGALTLEHSF